LGWRKRGERRGNGKFKVNRGKMRDCLTYLSFNSPTKISNGKSIGDLILH
jgi:hypothetical protein